MNPCDIQQLCSSIVPLENVESLVLHTPSDEFCNDLMIALGNLPGSKLKKFRLSYYGFPRRNHMANINSLPGIDVFFASNCASALTEVDIRLDGIVVKGMETLVSGLSQLSIETLNFHAERVDQEALHVLAGYIVEPPTSLKVLDIGIYQDDGGRFQRAVLPALYRNTTIEELCLTGVLTQLARKMSGHYCSKTHTSRN